MVEAANGRLMVKRKGVQTVVPEREVPTLSAQTRAGNGCAQADKRSRRFPRAV